MPSKQETADHKGVRIYEPWHANQSDARWPCTHHPRLRSSPCEGNTLRSKLNASATARLPTEQGTAQAPGWPASESAPWALPALLQQQAPLQQDAAIANEARTVAARVGKTIPYGMETGKKSNELMALGAPLKKSRPEECSSGLLCY